MKKERLGGMRGGFTIVEILVVVAVVGILTTMTMVGLQDSRGKARDARRMTDVDLVKKALEIYNSSNVGYPTTNGEYVCLNDETSNLYQEIVAGEKIIYSIPTDPLGIARDNLDTSEPCYAYISDGDDYKIVVNLEKDVDKMAVDNGSDEDFYEVYSYGARTWEAPDIVID